jgi:hypothetical protein
VGGNLLRQKGEQLAVLAVKMELYACYSSGKNDPPGDFIIHIGPLLRDRVYGKFPQALTAWGLAPHTAKMKANKKRMPKFSPGRAGCESLMFLVRGYRPGTPAAVDDKPAPLDTLRICANGIHEIMAHLKRWEPDFDIRSVRVIGLVVLLSGSPYE